MIGERRIGKSSYLTRYQFGLVLCSNTFINLLRSAGAPASCVFLRARQLSGRRLTRNSLS